jgi:probable HAF family extracellular repeat protein
MWAVPFSFDTAAPGATMLKLSGGYVSGSAWAVNDLGHVVGWASGNEDTWGRAFLHDGIVMTSLGTLSGKSYSIATAVNGLDEVVGQAFGEWVWYPCCGWLWTNSIKRAFLYRDGVITDLNTMMPAGTVGYLTVPVGINDSGKILCPLDQETVLLVPFAAADPDGDGNVSLADFAGRTPPANRRSTRRCASASSISTATTILICATSPSSKPG